MKTIHTILAVFVLVLAFACKPSGNEKQKSTDLVTIRTLGLAYLEEFKLPEAEEQFLRFIKLAPKEKLGYANLGLTYLRMAKYPEAEKQLLKAISIDPADPDIRLILATVYKMEDQSEKAVTQLKEALKSSPGHVKVLYELTELYGTKNDPAWQQERVNYMQRLVQQAPENLVPRLNLTDIFIHNELYDSAIAQLETIKRQFPEFPKEAVEFYNSTLQHLRKGDKENAIIQFTIFHNYMKVTAPYQAGMMDLKGPGGSLIGFPLITFDQQSSLNTMEEGAVLEALRFTDVTSSAGLDIIQGSGYSHIEASDFDSDGDIDLYSGYFNQSGAKHFLLSNELGRFTDVTQSLGLTHKGKELAVKFDDYDNDGFLDIFIITENSNLLYRNAGKGKFKEVSSDANLNVKAGGKNPLFFDADHDGDLDLLLLRPDKNLLFRNNADGTFTEQAEKMGITGTNLSSSGAVFADFDEDGDIDLYIANEKGSNALYANQREGVYKNVAAVSGLVTKGGSGGVAAADYNNDGFIDLFVGSVDGEGHLLYMNKHDGKFEKKNIAAFDAIKDLKVRDVRFFDFDNDGFQDLIIAGEPVTAGNRGLFLYHNDGKGGFTETTNMLPEVPNAARQVTLFDYNDDGDLDLALAGLDGKVYLLRNDGGNANHYIKMKLVGLTAGSAKNNHFGIGAKVEVRSGELYQTIVVTDPNVLFGLGNRKQADVVRITWTNGVPQNIFMPNSDQALIESQTLKGSCPFLYTWNGKEYVFAKDILWRSALGMPLGIMGGTQAYGFADASDDYIKIPGELLNPKNGRYSLQVTSELWETIYFDQLELVAVDHPASVDVFVPEQFSPPPFPGRKVYQVSQKIYPVKATDGKGNDVLPMIVKNDDVYITGFIPDKYQGIVEKHDLIIDPGKNTGDNLLLFMHGWIFPTDASINMALSQSDNLKVVSPLIQVMNKKGEWQTVIDNPGFPMGKDKTVVIDLSGKFLTNDHRVRVVTNMEIYWDEVFFSQAGVNMPLKYTQLQRVSANLHYRGFSRSFRKGGRYGPHWFDYSKVDQSPKWRDLAGNYTRYGDVLPLLERPDNQYIISNAGDEMTVEFNAKNLPALPAGWKRDFLIRSVGWVKDGDLNTAYGNSVLPLPFHGMKSYTPQNADPYPNTPELQKYNSEYNTRVVSSSAYLEALKHVNHNAD